MDDSIVMRVKCPSHFPARTVWQESAAEHNGRSFTTSALLKLTPYSGTLLQALYREAIQILRYEVSSLLQALLSIEVNVVHDLVWRRLGAPSSIRTAFFSLFLSEIDAQHLHLVPVCPPGFIRPVSSWRCCCRYLSRPHTPTATLASVTTSPFSPALSLVFKWGRLPPSAANRGPAARSCTSQYLQHGKTLLGRRTLSWR